MKYRGESEAPEAALENRLWALEARIAEAIHFGRGYERLLRERRIAAKLLGTARVHRLLVERGASART